MCGAAPGFTARTQRTPEPPDGLERRGIVHNYVGAAYGVRGREVYWSRVEGSKELGAVPCRLPLGNSSRVSRVALGSVWKRLAISQICCEAMGGRDIKPATITNPRILLEIGVESAFLN